LLRRYYRLEPPGNLSARSVQFRHSRRTKLTAPAMIALMGRCLARPQAPQPFICAVKLRRFRSATCGRASATILLRAARREEKMDEVSREKNETSSELQGNLQESWVHAALMVNDFVAHTAAAAAMLVAVKMLALLFEFLWPNSGFKAFEGTPFEFSVETIFVTAEIGIFIVYSIYAVIRGVRRCFVR
jgi:hypothetical protein